MRSHLLAALAAPLLLSWSSSAYCQDSSGTVLGDPTPAPVQDPSLANSHYFPPSLGTAGVAAIAPSRPGATAKTGRAACSATNPCATPTPARDRVTVAQSGS